MSSNVEPFQPGGRAVPEPEPEPDQLTAHDGPARRRPGASLLAEGTPCGLARASGESAYNCGKQTT